MNIALTGSTGLIGTALTTLLEAAGHTVRPMVRGEVRDPSREIRWNPRNRSIEASKLDGIDAVIHLAGKNVACRWNESVKKELRDSRVGGTRLLAETLSGLQHKPRVLCSASAIGFYGETGEAMVDEESPSGDHFLSSVCSEWEAANEAAWEAGIRVVEMRIGVVLSQRGGALRKMLSPFKRGLGGVIGPGSQAMSWVSLDDAAGAFKFAVENEHLHGAFNLVAPNPVTNREFTKTLGRVLGRPTFVPMPAFAARLAFGQMADELLLASTRVSSERLQQAGYQFQHPELEPMLRNVLGR